MLTRSRKTLALVLIFILFSTFFSCCAQATEIEKKSDDSIKAQSYLLMDSQSGRILLQNNEHEKMHPASITKLMTMLLTLEALEQGKIKITDQVTASELAMSMGGTEIWLEPGEKMSVQELLVAVSVGSANDACVALAEHIAGSETSFVKLMNKKAKEIGMKDSSFKNSNGLPDEGHYSSAYDIALLGKYLLHKYPQVLKYTSLREQHLRGGKTWLVNTNNMLGIYNGLDGLKTGWTEEAGFCLAATAKRENLRLISVVLGEESPKQRTMDTTFLLNYAFTNYNCQPVVKKNQIILQLKVYRGITDKISLVAADDLVAVVPTGEEEKIKKEVYINKKLFAPITQGQVLGELRIRDSKGEMIGKVNLTAGENIERGGILRIIFNFIMHLLTFWQR